MAMGVEAKAEAEDSVSVGHASRNVSNAVNGVAIGHGAINGAVSGMTPDGDSTVVLVGGGKNSVSVGNKANARGNSSIALGDGAVVQNDGGNRIVNNSSMAIGTAAKTVSSNNATAIGHGAFVAKTATVRLLSAKVPRPVRKPQRRSAKKRLLKVRIVWQPVLLLWPKEKMPYLLVRERKQKGKMRLLLGMPVRQPVPVLLLLVMRPARQPADLCLSVLVPVRA